MYLRVVASSSKYVIVLISGSTRSCVVGSRTAANKHLKPFTAATAAGLCIDSSLLYMLQECKACKRYSCSAHLSQHLQKMYGRHDIHNLGYMFEPHVQANGSISSHYDSYLGYLVCCMVNYC
jgi:hypothetical protein